MAHLDLKHAFAVLGLPPGSSLPTVRSRFRALASKWHPDRHHGNPADMDQALTQMRAITEAYCCICDSLDASAAPPERTPLSREQIDRLVASVGTQSWVDSATAHLPYAGAADWFLHQAPGSQWRLTAEGKVLVVFLVGCVGIYAVHLRGGDALNSPLWYLVFGVAMLASIYWSRRS